MTDSELIRLVERTVLDERHKQYAILQAPVRIALIHLLRATQHVLREPKLFAEHDAVQFSMWQSNFFKAVSFALRWAYLECPRNSQSTTATSEDLDEAALSLIFEWGIPYTELTAQHVAWSNGLQTANTIPHDNTIIFGPPEEFDVNNVFDEVTTIVRGTENEYLAFPKSSFIPLFNDWQNHAEWTEHGLEFDPEFIINHDRFYDMRDWLKRAILPELDDNVELGQYSLGDLRQFLTAALTISECIKTLESLVDERVGLSNGMGSWIFKMKSHQAVEWYSRATSLPRDIVGFILDDLTADLARFHFSIASSPILRIDDDVLIGQRLLASLRPAHFVARTLTIGSGRRKYDRVSTLLERKRLDIVEKHLRDGGLNVLREYTFTCESSLRFTPDLLVWDDLCAELMVIDFKNALSATGPAEVANRMREHRKGVRQIENYLQHLRSNASLLTPHMGALPCAPKIVGGLLYWTPLGLPVSRHSGIVFDSWDALVLRTADKNKIALADLQAPMHFDAKTSFQTIPLDIKVGIWTYRRFVWVKQHSQVKSG